MGPEPPQPIDVPATIDVTRHAEQRSAFRWSLRWLAMAGATIVPFAIALATQAPVLAGLSVLGGAFASFFAASYAAGSASPRRAVEQGRVRIEDEGLWWDPDGRISRERIEGGAADDDELVLALRDGDEVRIRGPQGAMRHALDVLGIGPDRRRAVVRWTVRPLRLLAYFAAVGAGFTVLGAWMKLVPAPLVPLAWPLMMPVFVGAWPIARAFGDREVIVGSDEVLVRSGRRVSSVRIAALRAIREDGRTLVLEPTEGAAIRVRIGDQGTRRALMHRLERAIAAASRTGETARVARLLERRGRTLEAWKAELAVLLEARSGHREGALTHDAIARVLDDPGASAEQRIGATLALALYGHADDERITRALETSAAPKVRVAIHAAALGELDERTLDDATGVASDRGAA